MNDRDSLIEELMDSSTDEKERELFRIGKKIESGEQITEEELDAHTAHMLQLLTYPFVKSCKNIEINGLVSTATSAIVTIAKVCEKRTKVPYYVVLGRAISVYAGWDAARAKKDELNG